MRRTRGTQRRQRQAVPLATIALVGYTNAGKSTLFNRLTGAEVLADARMFATLDPTVRHITLPSRRKVLLSDTVGFIRNLPTTLVKAFRATLEEVVEASLLLHVVDASSPYAPASDRARAQGAGRNRRREDDADPGVEQDGSESPSSGRGLRLSASEFSAKCAAPPGSTEAIPVSARTGAGIEDVCWQPSTGYLPLDPISRARFRIPANEGFADPSNP